MKFDFVPTSILIVTFILCLFPAPGESSGLEAVSGDAGLTPPYPETFVRYENNPILDVGEPGSLDDASVSHPTVTKDGTGDYMMYYAMYEATQIVAGIGLALSEDGITWTKHPNNPVLASLPGGGGETYNVWPSHVLKVDSLYHMYYDQYMGMLEYPQVRIQHATSTDGIVWNRDLEAQIPADAPIVRYPSVLKDGGTFKMWHSVMDVDTAKFHIAYAVSENGSTFVGQGVVMEPGGLGEIDAGGLYFPVVEKNPDGSGYTMHYSGSGPSGYTICRAVSDDGIAWSTAETELAPSVSEGFDAKDAALGSLVSVGNRIRMYYAGRGLDDVWRIGLAEQAYTPEPADLNKDGVVDEKDLLLLLNEWHR